MRIDKKTYLKMPLDLKVLFLKAPNPGSEEVVGGFPHSKSGKNTKKGISGSDWKGNTGSAFGAESRPAGTPMVSYGDAGSAARFFHSTREGESSSNRRYEDKGGTNFAMLPGMRRNDPGSASRFFYCPKVSRSERNDGLNNPGPQFKHGSTLRKIENTKTVGNTHPTVKPLALMKYLIKLVTRREGVILDPFMGSGSTGVAAILSKKKKWRFIGIEKNREYMGIAKARVKHALKKSKESSSKPNKKLKLKMLKKKKTKKRNLETLGMKPLFGDGK